MRSLFNKVIVWNENAPCWGAGFRVGEVGRKRGHSHSSWALQARCCNRHWLFGYNTESSWIQHPSYLYLKWSVPPPFFFYIFILRLWDCTLSLLRTITLFKFAIQSPQRIHSTCTFVQSHEIDQIVYCEYFNALLQQLP